MARGMLGKSGVKTWFAIPKSAGRGSDYGMTATPVVKSACRTAPLRLKGIGSFNQGAQSPGR